MINSFINKILLILFLVFILSESVLALTHVSTYPVTLSGVVYITNPCTFNNNQNMDLDFGKLAVSKVDGVNFKKDVVIDFVCTGVGANSNVYVQLVGNLAGAAKNILATNKANLGIKFSKNTQDINLNELIKIIPGQYLIFQVVPIKIDGAAILSGGFFSASITLISRIN